MPKNYLDLTSRVALVTGASAGLGAAIAVALAAAGANVVAHGNSREPNATCRLIKDAGRRSLAVRGDLADKAVPRQLITQTLDEFGRLDILINNAGTIRRAPAVALRFATPSVLVSLVTRKKRTPSSQS